MTDVGEDFEFFGPSTPAMARFQQRERYGALWTFGVKGAVNGVRVQVERDP